MKPYFIAGIVMLALSGCQIIVHDDNYPYAAQRCVNCFIESGLCPEILLEDASYRGCTGNLYDEYTEEDHEFLCERNDTGRIWEFSCDFTGE